MYSMKKGQNIYENEQNLPKIELWSNDSAGLILPIKSGVWISNQVGGYSCNQHGLEGTFVPIGWRLECLNREFTETKYGGWCDSGIDAETANLIDAWTLAGCHNRHNDIPFKVNRRRLNECQEAWIWVTLATNTYRALNFAGFKGDAILTWPNSD